MLIAYCVILRENQDKKLPLNTYILLWQYDSAVLIIDTTRLNCSSKCWQHSIPGGPWGRFHKWLCYVTVPINASTPRKKQMKGRWLNIDKASQIFPRREQKTKWVCASITFIMTQWDRFEKPFDYVTLIACQKKITNQSLKRLFYDTNKLIQPLHWVLIFWLKTLLWIAGFSSQPTKFWQQLQLLLLFACEIYLDVYFE